MEFVEHVGQKRRSSSDVITGGSVHATGTWNKGLCVKKPSARKSQRDEGFIVKGHKDYETT